MRYCDDSSSLTFKYQSLSRYCISHSSRIEEEKSAVMSELEEYHQKQVTWSREKSELQMNQAELNAENRQVKEDLKVSSIHVWHVISLLCAMWHIRL